MAGEPVIVREPAGRDLVNRLAGETFGDMVKLVVDVERGIMAMGGALHSDGEELLLDDGSVQKDIWGANYYPGRPPGEKLELSAMINIRPREGNRSMRIESDETSRKVRSVAEKFLPGT